MIRFLWSRGKTNSIDLESVILFFLLFLKFILFYFLTLQYCIGFAKYQNPPQIHTCSPSGTLLPPPSPYHPSGSSQCTSPKHPVSCISSNEVDETGAYYTEWSKPERKTPIQYLFLLKINNILEISSLDKDNKPWMTAMMSL